MFSFMLNHIFRRLLKTHRRSLTEEISMRAGFLILNFRDIILLALILMKFPLQFYYFSERLADLFPRILKKLAYLAFEILN